MKNSFIVYHEYRAILEDLTDVQVGKLFRAILDYEIDGKEPTLNGALKIAFKCIKKDLDINKSKYEKKCERNKANIAKRWNTKNTSGKNGTPNDTKNTDNDNEDDNEDDNENEDEVRRVFVCGEILEAVLRWLRYKKRNGLTYDKEGLQCLITEIKSDIENHGESYVVQSINHSIASQYKAIVFKPYDHNAPTKEESDQIARIGLEKILDDYANPDRQTPDGWEKIGDKLVRVK